MDESSAKRRERLNAMRLDASNQLQSQSQTASSSLLNPLLYPSSDDTNPQPLQRFDFYTDPVGSFSGSKTKNQDYNISSPIHRPYIPEPRNYHASSHQSQPDHSPWRSPLHGSPFSGSSGGFPPPNQNPWQSPAQHSPLQYNTRIPIGNYRGASPGYGSFSSPNFRPRGGSPHHNPRHSHSGGRGQWSSGSDLGGYYKKSMVEDPWRDLTPVVGDILVPRSRMQYFANTKRLKVDGSGGGGGGGGGLKLSLAENLALSLEEAANEELDN